MRIAPVTLAGESRQRALEVVAASLVALFAGYVMATRGAPTAFALILVPMVGVVLLASPSLTLALGIVLALVFPYTDALGSAQATWFRLAAGAAVLATLVVAYRSRGRPR